MRILVTAAVAIAFVVLVPGQARAASCAPTLTWRGTVYYSGFGVRGVDLGARVGTGLQPYCPSTGPPAEGPPTRLELRRIRGVLPAVAVGLTRARRVYLADGYVIESPLHPLHRFLGGSPSIGSPSEPRGSCGAAFRRTGRVTSTPPNAIRVGRAQYFVDARTVFSGRVTRHGIPYLGRGMRVGLSAVRCQASGGRSKLVALRFWRVTGAGLTG